MTNNFSNVYPLFGASKEKPQPRKQKEEPTSITCKPYNEGFLIDLDDLGDLHKSNAIYIKLDGKVAMTITPSS